MDIDTLEAGRELDALVSVLVMDEKGRPFPYSTNIAAAWLVVQKFRYGHNAPGQDAVACVVEMRYTDAADNDSECRIFSTALAPVYACARDLPLAICRAALKAVTGEPQKAGV